MSKFSRLCQGNRSSPWECLWFQDITDLNFPVLTCTPFIPQCWAPPTSLTRSSPIISTCKGGRQRIDKREMCNSFISLQVTVVTPCGSSFLANKHQHLVDPFHVALPSLNDSFLISAIISTDLQVLVVTQVLHLGMLAYRPAKCWCRSWTSCPGCEALLWLLKREELVWEQALLRTYTVLPWSKEG